MHENFDKKGQKFHKNFGTEKALPNPAPVSRGEGYVQVGSSRSYPGRSTLTVGERYDVKVETPTFAKAGGKSLVFVRKPSKGVTSFPGTTAKNTLKPPMSDKPTAR